MLRTITTAYLCLTAGLLAASARAEMTVEEAEKVLVENFKTLRSYKAKVASREAIDFGEGKTLRSEVSGTVEWVRKDGKLFYRSDADSSSVQTFNNMETPTHSKTTMIADGEFFYTLSEVMGQSQATKQMPHPSLVADPASMLKSLREEHEIKLAPKDEMIEGAPCFVFEVRPKKPEDSQMVKMMIYFRKDIGLSIKTVGFDKSDAIVYTTRHSEIKNNIEINPDRFVFTLPDGVKLVDMTQ